MATLRAPLLPSFPPLSSVRNALKRLNPHSPPFLISPSSSILKSFPFLRHFRASFNPHSSVAFLRAASIPITMLKPSRSRSTVCYSSGSSEGRSVERLVQHLLVEEEDAKLLTELQKKIAEGVDLSDLAVEHSICPSKKDGGMLGWVRRGQMVPEFEEVAFGAPLNKVVRCKTQFGWHLVQVISERDEPLLRDIGPEELHSKMENPAFFEEAQLIDVREPDEVAMASIPGFKVLPLRQFGNWGPEIANDFDPQKDTYVLCHHGVRSLQVAQWLQTQGFTKVFNVSGGIHAYALMADPSIPTY
ncbi:rhodanese-like domain-containing protein / PPIC-type PPIASE domain-containing protein [Wolffia australiana]